MILVVIEMIADESSEAEFSAETRSLNVIVDMLMGYWFLDDLLDAEGSIAGGVKVSGLGVEGSLLSFPLIDFVDLDRALPYNFVPVDFVDVDNMSERWYNIDVDASE